MPYAKDEDTHNPLKKISKDRWIKIKNALLRDDGVGKIKNMDLLEKATKSYNTDCKKPFTSSRAVLAADDLFKVRFFRCILKERIHLALDLPEIVPCAIPLLKTGQNKSISMS